MEKGQAMNAPKIVLATRNAGKIRELADGLRAFGLEVLGLDAFPEMEDVAETGVSFEENAFLKASAVARHTGCIAVADDSGVEVDALGGAPGIYSARYSDMRPCPPEGEDPALSRDDRNNLAVLHELVAVPDEKRTGRFVCAMCACKPDGSHIALRAVWEGRILRASRGTNGFGYDPLFFDPKVGRTAAELSREEKNERSHRGSALRKLLALWPDFYAGGYS
jgi:XTP/dITP diphosphohydrolase